ncbi:Pentatricopeptide repeat [Dillenia turbinata]|uniref:Pentatricopeptide repeat n=1 Tax=Dillenia turbinata TaxID=194707 RepID=A0AAN8YZR3_9MAGN
MRSLFFIRHYCSYLTLNQKTKKNPLSKDSQILQLCKSGLLAQALLLVNKIDSQEISIKPLVYAGLLQTCVKVHSFNHGLQIHSHVIKSGLEGDRFVGNSLLALYFKLGPNFKETQKVFEGMLYRDVISWTSMITGYVREGEPRSSISLFWEMMDCGVDFNEFTLCSVIKACSELGEMKLGKCVHGVVWRCGFPLNHVIASALIDMYGRNNGLENAWCLFHELVEPDAICWTSVISAFTRSDMFEEALGFFYWMQRNYELMPDGFTFGSVLTACGNLSRLRQGKEVHSKVIVAGFHGNVVVESSLVDMYAKCGSVLEAQRVFDRMPKKNGVSWCALLGGYCQIKDYESVVRNFRLMKDVDLYSFGTILRACAGLAAVREGKEVHCQYLRRGGWSDVIVESALVDLYAKCGCINFAQRVFSKMSTRNLITWNSMISGLAQNGRGVQAVKVFNEMIEEGIRPDYISFIGVLFACSHTGLVEEGREYFALMTQVYGIKPGIEHYNCMVDLLGRAGLLEEAENLILNADCKDSALWEVLLGACTASTNPVVAERIARKLMELEPDKYLSYVYLANLYRSIGRWNDALEIRKLMTDRKVKKMPGKSWIDTDDSLGSYKMGQSNIAKLTNASNLG